MKLWLISQDFNYGYDTYDSAVVAAPTEEAARQISPSDSSGTWCSPEHVGVQLIGEALPGTSEGVILGSFNAG